MPPEVKILTGYFDPLRLLRTYGHEEYEEITLEWANSYLGKKYVRVERIGGSGDKGRDVVCQIDNVKWDNYQCKHYDKPLASINVWLEIGKLVYFTFVHEYSVPEKYYFVAPCGVTVQLRDLLKAPEKLRAGLKAAWGKHCAKKITTKKEILLEDKLLAYVDQFNFSIFDYVSPQEFIEQFKNTPQYAKRFGELQKARPMQEEYPEEIQQLEFTYVRKILDAYADHLKTSITSTAELRKYPELQKHFERQRRNFYSAEYLKAHSREIYEPEMKYFEKLKEEIYDSIIDQIEDDAQNGFERLKKVLVRAEQLSISNNPLRDCLNIKDKKGLCHHLANEREDVKWKK